MTEFGDADEVFFRINVPGSEVLDCALLLLLGAFSE